MEAEECGSIYSFLMCNYSTYSASCASRYIASFLPGELASGDQVEVEAVEEVVFPGRVFAGGVWIRPGESVVVVNMCCSYDWSPTFRLPITSLC